MIIALAKCVRVRSENHLAAWRFCNVWLKSAAPTWIAVIARRQGLVSSKPVKLEMLGSIPVPMGLRRVGLLTLLVSTAIASLLGGAPAFAACSDYINTTAAGCTNNGTISGLTVSNSTVTSDIVNNGTIAPNGVVTQNGSTINASIVNGGSIAGGLSIDQTSSIVNTATGVTLAGTSFSGDLSNAGTITINGAGSNSGLLAESATFAGNITNTGAINIGATTPGTSGVGIQVDNSLDLTTFVGGIRNGGSITAKATNDVGNRSALGIAVQGSQSGHGLLGAVTGGITNSGTINVSMAGAGNNTPAGIFVSNVSTFQGGITNTAIGSIATQISGGSNVAPGIFVNQVGSLLGGISNAGSITSNGPNAQGILLANTNVQDGVSNAGSIIASGANARGISFSVVILQGGISNAGSITASGAGPWP